MDDINISNLASDNVILYNKIMQEYFNKMNSLTTFSSTKCSITIDRIVLTNSNNCKVNVENKCFTENSTSAIVLMEILIENKNLMDDDTIKKLEKSLNIDFSASAENQKETNFAQKCNASASVTENIRVKNLVVDNCNATTETTFTFYNTGDSKANCSISNFLIALTNDTDDDETTLYKKYNFMLDRVLTLNLKDLLIIIILILIIFISTFITFFFKEKKIVYQYKRDIF